MNTAFLDTNVLIAWIFLINSFHPKSVDVFNSYSQFFWSFSVVKEFEKKFNVKSKNLIRFFLDLQKFLENPEKDLYSLSDLIDFANERCSKQLLNEVKSSVKPFWSEYLGIQSRIPFFDMKNAIDFCLNDLLLNLDINKRSIEEIMQLSPQRSNDYSQIDAMLESFGVHEEDRKIILDGHDFACFSSQPVDFVTFDDYCFNGAKNIDLLCFNSVKGKYDFRAS